MSEPTIAASPAGAPAATATPAAPAARPSTSDLVAAATKALEGAAAEPVAPVAPAAPVLPSTPEAPATAAVLEAQESASAQIRARNELADARKAFEAEKAAWQAQNKPKLERADNLERLLAEFERDPAALIKAKEGGRSADEIAKDLYLETVDVTKLPPEQQAAVLQHRELLALKRNQARLEARLVKEEQQRTQAEVSRQIATYRGELATGLSAISDTTPLVKELVGKRPDLVVGMMMDVAGRLAVEQPTLGVQNAAQLAERIEQALAAEIEPFTGYFERKFKPAAPPPVVAPPPPAASPAQEARAISSSITDATSVTRRPTTDNERIAAATRALSGMH